MSVFSKLTSSKKQAQKLQDEKQQKAKASDEPKPKYMHTPKHAFVDALNSVSGPSPADNIDAIRSAAERRKSRMSQNSSFANISGLHTANSSSSAITTMSSWEARKAMAHREQLQKAAVSMPIASTRKSYQSSPLASVANSTAGPSTVSSYDRLEMAHLSPAPLRPSLQKSGSSSSYPKKSVTIQDPSTEPPSPTRSSPSSRFSQEDTETPLVAVIKPGYMPLGKTVTVKSIELTGDISSEEEKDTTAKKGRKRFPVMFWKRKTARPVAAAAAAA